MFQHVQSLTEGFNGLILMYASVMIPLVLGLRRGRAPVESVFRGPLWAVPAMFVASIVFDFVKAPLLDLGVNRKSGWLDIFGALVFICVGYAAGRLLAVLKRSPDEARHRRGTVVLKPEACDPGAIEPGVSVTLAGIPVAAADETKHFKLIGTTGTGKSTAIRELLGAALARGDRAIIADPDGGYLNTFYDAGRGDVILNPFMAGSAKWSLLGEVTNDYDVEQLARSLIPDSGDPDRVWSDYARTFFTAVVQQVRLSQVRDDGEVNRLFNEGGDKELRDLLAKTSAGPLVAEGNERMFGNVRSITTSALRSLKYVTTQRGTPFSVREWVSKGAARQAGGSGGVLFLPYKAGQIAALRTLISAWMRLAIFEAMNREEGDQRLWFVVDELDALGEIDGLKDALARLRKFGGRSLLGFQSIAQVSSTYGKGEADTIVENCGNTLILRCSASEHGGTAEFASKLIGQREVTHTTRSRTRQPGAWRASTTSSEQVKIEPAVLPSEIERLPDLEGYLKFASIPDWRAVRLSAPVSVMGESKQRRAEAGVGPSGVAAASVVMPDMPGSGDDGFARPPLGSAGSVRPAYPGRKRQGVKRSRKPRVNGADSNGGQGGGAQGDVRGAP